MNALEIIKLNKGFGNFKLENINLTLPQGYIMGYIGQNGAGKTTTIKLIIEQLKKDSGEIRVFGKQYADDEIAFKNSIGFVADECYFPGCFTPRDVMMSLKSFYDTFDEREWQEYLRRWELPENKKIKAFSKGMKVKLMFAGVLSRDTRLLVLDEPTSGLDPLVRSEILDVLQEYIADGKRSVLFSTHIMSDLEKIADFLYFIDHGKTIFNDTKDNVLENYWMIKGGHSDLTPQLQEKMIGYRKSSVGFEGLLHSKDRKHAGNGVLIEKPSVDDIVIFHINKVKGAV